MYRALTENEAPVELTGADRISLKVCGVTQADQVKRIRELGVDLLGLNFHPRSPRFVEPEVAKVLVEAWGDRSSVAGVFVDRSADAVLAILNHTGVGIAQLHGDESAQTVAEVSRHVPVIRAFRLRNHESLEQARTHLRAIESAGGALLAVLIDGYASNAHGGTGQTVAEELVRAAVGLHPRLILAGGLRPDNLDERMRWIRPWCFDVASGVESTPGIKDLNSIKAMLSRIRST